MNLIVLIANGLALLQLASAQGSRTAWSAQSAGAGLGGPPPVDFNEHQINMAIVQINAATTEEAAVQAATTVYNPMMDMSDAVQNTLEDKIRQLRTPPGWPHPIPPPLPPNFDPMHLVMAVYYGQPLPSPQQPPVPAMMGGFPGQAMPRAGPPTNIVRGSRQGPGMSPGPGSPGTPMTGFGYEPTPWEVEMAVHNINAATTEAGAAEAAAAVYRVGLDTPDVVVNAFEEKVARLRTPSTWTQPRPKPLPATFRPHSFIIRAWRQLQQLAAEQQAAAAAQEAAAAAAAAAAVPSRSPPLANTPLPASVGPTPPPPVIPKPRRRPNDFPNQQWGPPPPPPNNQLNSRRTSPPRHVIENSRPINGPPRHIVESFASNPFSSPDHRSPAYPRDSPLPTRTPKRRPDRVDPFLAEKNQQIHMKPSPPPEPKPTFKTPNPGPSSQLWDSSSRDPYLQVRPPVQKLTPQNHLDMAPSFKVDPQPTSGPRKQQWDNSNRDPFLQAGSQVQAFLPQKRQIAATNHDLPSLLAVEPQVRSPFREIAMPLGPKKTTTTTTTTMRPLPSTQSPINPSSSSKSNAGTSRRTKTSFNRPSNRPSDIPSGVLMMSKQSEMVRPSLPARSSDIPSRDAIPTMAPPTKSPVYQPARQVTLQQRYPGLIFKRSQPDPQIPSLMEFNEPMHRFKEQAHAVSRHQIPDEIVIITKSPPSPPPTNQAPVVPEHVAASSKLHSSRSHRIWSPSGALGVNINEILKFSIAGPSDSVPIPKKQTPKPPVTTTSTTTTTTTTTPRPTTTTTTRKPLDIGVQGNFPGTHISHSKPSTPAPTASGQPLTSDQKLNQLQTLLEGISPGQLQSLVEVIKKRANGGSGSRSDTQQSPVPASRQEPPPRDMPRDFPRDMPRDFPRDMPRDVPRDFPRDMPRDMPRDFPRDMPRDMPRDFPRDMSRDMPRDFPRDMQRDMPRDFPRDLPRDRSPFSRGPPGYIPPPPGSENRGAPPREFIRGSPNEMMGPGGPGDMPPWARNGPPMGGPQGGMGGPPQSGSLDLNSPQVARLIRVISKGIPQMLAGRTGGARNPVTGEQPEQAEGGGMNPMMMAMLMNGGGGGLGGLLGGGGGSGGNPLADLLGGGGGGLASLLGGGSGGSPDIASMLGGGGGEMAGLARLLSGASGSSGEGAGGLASLLGGGGSGGGAAGLAALLGGGGGGGSSSSGEGGGMMNPAMLAALMGGGGLMGGSGEGGAESGAGGMRPFSMFGGLGGSV